MKGNSMKSTILSGRSILSALLTAAFYLAFTIVPAHAGWNGPLGDYTIYVEGGFAWGTAHVDPNGHYTITVGGNVIEEGRISADGSGDYHFDGNRAGSSVNGTITPNGDGGAVNYDQTNPVNHLHELWI
jgi:hypothetical protein